MLSQSRKAMKVIQNDNWITADLLQESSLNPAEIRNKLGNGTSRPIFLPGNFFYEAVRFSIVR